MKKTVFVIGLLLAVLILSYVFSRLQMPALKLESPPAPLRYKLAHRDTIPYVPHEANPKVERTPEASVEPDASPRPLDFDACHAPNAQEVWYRIAANYNPQLVVKNFYFASEGNRMLLIHQDRKLDAASRPYIQISAAWYDRSSSNETLPKELLNETHFLDYAELLDLAGPAWTNGIGGQTAPLLQEEVFTLGKDDESVTLQNKVAVTLHARIGGHPVVCEKEEDCRCQ